MSLTRGHHRGGVEAGEEEAPPLLRVGGLPRPVEGIEQGGQEVDQGDGQHEGIIEEVQLQVGADPEGGAAQIGDDQHRQHDTEGGPDQPQAPLGFSQGEVHGGRHVKEPEQGQGAQEDEVGQAHRRHQPPHPGEDAGDLRRPDDVGDEVGNVGHEGPVEDLLGLRPDGPPHIVGQEDGEEDGADQVGLGVDDEIVVAHGSALLSAGNTTILFVVLFHTFLSMSMGVPTQIAAIHGAAQIL